jgi:hypothetical protein
MVCDGEEVSQIIPVKHRANPHFCRRNAQACGSTEPLRSGSSNCTGVSNDWEGDMRSISALAGAVGLAALVFISDVSAQNAESES